MEIIEKVVNSNRRYFIACLIYLRMKKDLNYIWNK